MPAVPLPCEFVVTPHAAHRSGRPIDLIPSGHLDLRHLDLRRGHAETANAPALAPALHDRFWIV